MKYIVVKENKINNNIPEISGIWYIVKFKNPILRIFEILDNNTFRDKNEAIECARLKSINKWDCTESKEKIYETSTQNTEKKRDWPFDIIMSCLYLFGGFYLLVMGVESISGFAERHNNIIHVLSYALGVMAISVLIGIKVTSALLDGSDLHRLQELEKKLDKHLKNQRRTKK